MSPYRSEDYVRAGRLLQTARVLRHRRWRTRRAFVDDPDVDVSYRTVSDVELGRIGRRHGWDPGTIALLEHAVGWAPGSYDAALGGGEPTMQDGADPDLPEEVTIRVRDIVSNQNLSDAMREELLAVIADAAQSYESGIRPARRRDDAAS